MLVRRQRAAEMGGFITDARKFLHKFAPRELSPTRLLEKFATDTKKKGAALVSATATVAAKKQEAADDVAVAQLMAIQAAAPVTLPPALAAALPPAGVVKRKPVAGFSMDGPAPYYVGGALILLGAAWWFGRRS